MLDSLGCSHGPASGWLVAIYIVYLIDGEQSMAWVGATVMDLLRFYVAPDWFTLLWMTRRFQLKHKHSVVLWSALLVCL